MIDQSDFVDVMWSRAQLVNALKKGKVIALAASGLTIKFVLCGGIKSGFLTSTNGAIRRFQSDSAAWRVVDSIQASAGTNV